MRVILETNTGTVAASYDGGDYITVHMGVDNDTMADLIRIWDYEENVSVFKMSPKELAKTVQDWLKEHDSEIRVDRITVQTEITEVD